MKSRSTLIMLLFLSTTHLYAQRNQTTANFDFLDKSFFKWKQFSFNQPWERLKEICDLEKIDAYSDTYLDFYCGNISSTSKSYLLNNKIYHSFDDIGFDQVILHMKGSTKSAFNNNSIYFIKQESDSVKSNAIYKEILKDLKKKYGDVHTEHMKKNAEDSITGNSVRETLSENYPFPSIEQTKWEGRSNIYMTLCFSKENNFIILSVQEYPTRSLLTSKTNNLFAESEYDETFTTIFKDFEKRNGYKQLKFGLPKATVENMVKLKRPDALRQYAVVNYEYKNWFHIHFDDCNLTFNKNNKLYDVQLSKEGFTNDEYEKFLIEIISLFGEPKKQKDNSNGEYAVWNGKSMTVIVMRPDENSIFVDFECIRLDDSSPSDKLY
ncbi:MAG: hypothetical protein P4L35_19530 [Ignavibacteriaceae bacterium]|nr:hypothetical protein [Ignavibacteriaceae bacterium]